MKNITLSALIIALCCNISLAQTARVTGPHLLVYKTKKDYHNLVPVILSPDRSKIVSYPDPHDLVAAGHGILPSALHKGYLLDNKGIGINTAFLKLTYHDYEHLKNAPTTDELYRMIIDKDPLVVLCDCGMKSSFKNPAKQINQLIDRKELLKKCKSLMPEKAK